MGSSDNRLCPFELKMDTTTALLSIEAIKEISDCDMQLHFSVGLLVLWYWLVDVMVGVFWDDCFRGFFKLQFRKISIHRI